MKATPQVLRLKWFVFLRLNEVFDAPSFNESHRFTVGHLFIWNDNESPLAPLTSGHPLLDAVCVRLIHASLDNNKILREDAIAKRRCLHLNHSSWMGQQGKVSKETRLVLQSWMPPCRKLALENARTSGYHSSTAALVGGALPLEQSSSGTRSSAMSFCFTTDTGQCRASFECHLNSLAVSLACIVLQ